MFTTIESQRTFDLLTALSAWPQVSVVIDDRTEVATVYLHGGGLTIADVRRRPPQLRIRGPRDVLELLQRSRPLGWLERDALVFDLRDQRAYRMALSVLRARIREERFEWQMRVESP